MALKIVGKTIGNKSSSTPIVSENGIEHIDHYDLPESKADDVGQKPLDIAIGTAENLEMAQEKPIAFFTEPKRVKKKTQKDIVIFQFTTATMICGIMLFFRQFAPELYENLQMYFLRLFV